MEGAAVAAAQAAVVAVACRSCCKQLTHGAPASTSQVSNAGLMHPRPVLSCQIVTFAMIPLCIGAWVEHEQQQQPAGAAPAAAT